MIGLAFLYAYFWLRITIRGRESPNLPRRTVVRYNHRVGLRGGIEIVEYFGTDEGDVAVVIKNLKQAQAVYKRLERKLDRFIDGE